MTADPRMTCIHQPHGLCPACQADYDDDQMAWLEYGHHAQGEANARELLDAIADDACQPQVVIDPAGDEIPF